MTPAEEDVNFLSTAITGNEGRHTYTVSGLDPAADYDIALLPAENVVVTDGTVSFTSVATVADNSGPSIEVVNGALLTTAGSGSETEQTNDVSPAADGTITFSIDSDAADQVIPVIWLDAESTGDNTLDRDADGVPTEEFGIGGQKNWVPAEATAGTTAETVDAANLNLDYFVSSTGGETYFYDSNDIYRFNGGADVSMDVFEGMLTAGDVISVTYDPDAADTSIFNVTTDAVPAPTGLTATVSDLDGDGTADDATLTWNASTQADAVYNVYVDDGDNTLDAGDTVVAADLTTTSLEINNAVGNTYHVGAEGGVSGSVSTGDPSASPAAPVDAVPAVVANGTLVAVDDDADDAASAGDVWYLFVSEAVSVASDATIQLGSGAIYENNVNATIAYDSTLGAVTVTLNAAPGEATAYPATITSFTGVVDADEGGQAWTTAADNTLDDDGAEFLSVTGVDGSNTITVVFNEALVEVSAENVNNYSFDPDGAGAAAAAEVPTSATLSADGRTVTLTTTTAVDATVSTLATAATLLDDDGQASDNAATVVAAP